MGLARFGLGGLAAPLVGLGGANTVLPLGIVTTTAIGLAIVAQIVLTGHKRETERSNLVEDTTSGEPELVTSK